MHLVFYTRPGCHLCDEALPVARLLAEDFHALLEERNIEAQDEWTEQYGLMIPVLTVEDHVIAYGQIDYVSAYNEINLKFKK